MVATYEQLPDTSRVWIYQSSRPFNEEETDQLQSILTDFAQRWVSHNRQLRAFGGLFHRQFLVLMVDESQAGASGCSIDSSVHFMQGLESQFGVQLFDRMTFTYLDGDAVQTAGRDEFSQLYQAGKINDLTPVFDNLVSNKADFNAKWVKPLGESWHKRMV